MPLRVSSAYLGKGAWVRGYAEDLAFDGTLGLRFKYIHLLARHLHVQVIASLLKEININYWLETLYTIKSMHKQAS